MKFSQVSNVLRASMIACALIFALSGDAICRQQETAEQFIERVRDAIKNDEWKGAKSGIRHALALKPDLPETQFLAAQVYWHEGARSMAIESLNKAVEMQPVYPEAHFLLARCLLDASEREQAREQANIAISQGTPAFPAYRFLGELDFAAGNVEAAASSFETAVKLSQPRDEKEATELRQEIQGLREYIKLLPILEGEQKATDVVRPIALNSPQPRYTEEARAAKIQGAVSMVVLVTANGDVDSVVLFRRLGHGLDDQATEVARQLKFAPANRNGKPIPYWMKVMVEFNSR